MRCPAVAAATAVVQEVVLQALDGSLGAGPESPVDALSKIAKRPQVPLQVADLRVARPGPRPLEHEPGRLVAQWHCQPPVLWQRRERGLSLLNPDFYMPESSEDFALCY